MVSIPLANTAGPEPVLDIRDLNVSFRTAAGKVRVVDGVNLSVRRGEAVGLVGKSGCGKSALVKSILRLHDPANTIIGPGAIFYRGSDLLKLSQDAIRRVRGGKIALIPQDPMTSLDPVIPIGRQIEEAMAAHLSISRSERRDRVMNLLAKVGIPEPRKRIRWFPHQFSGGMRQRIVIAMALSCEPDLILADEITTALDVTLQAQILELLANLARDLQTAILMITHDLGVIAGMTQRVYVMYAGRVTECATTERLFDAPRMPYTWGLLNSAPNLDEPDGKVMVPIEGTPPDFASPPPGCRFAPRCLYRQDVCEAEEPPLVAEDDQDVEHNFRCWATQKKEPGGWLADFDSRSGKPTHPMAGTVK